MLQPKVRVIVRPWIPKRIPFQIPSTQINQTLNLIRPKLKKVLYVGWGKRIFAGTKSLCYLAATGETLKEARANFKSEDTSSQNVWLLYPLNRVGP